MVWYSVYVKRFIHPPMAAKLMTGLNLDSTSTTLDIEQFNIERFRRGKLLATTRLL